MKSLTFVTSKGGLSVAAGVLLLLFNACAWASVPPSQGSCADNPVGAPGLPCVVDLGLGQVPPDALANPVPPDPLTSYNNDTEIAVRAAVYDATGVDPGTLTQIAKGEDDNGWSTGGLVVTGGGTSSGTWEYTFPTNGDPLLFLTLKTARQFEVFDIASLITSGTNDGSGTIIGDWDTFSLGSKGLSHLSLFTGTGTVPEPMTAALLLFGLAGIYYAHGKGGAGKSG